MVRVMPTMAWSRLLLLGLAVAILVGCGGPPRPPLDTQDELRAEWARHRGWWRPDDLCGGYCEHDTGRGFPQSRSHLSI